VANLTVKRVDEMDTAYSGGMKLARAALGVTSFGLQQLDFPPGFDGYPEHDHGSDGQEEVYVGLSGGVILVVDDQEHKLEPGVMARVGPGQMRKLVTRDEGGRVLAIGGTPGKAYEPPEYTNPA
jgi:uncharacterized cupin superfamily protein